MAKGATTATDEPTLALRRALIAEILGEPKNGLPPGSPGEHIIKTLVTSAMTSPKSARWVYEQFEGKATQTQHILSDSRSRVIVEVVTVDMVSGKPQLAAGSDESVIDGEVHSSRGTESSAAHVVERIPARARVEPEPLHRAANLPASGTAVAIDLDTDDDDNNDDADDDA